MVSAPVYVIRPNMRRIIIPDILKTVLLCLIFFFTIKMNIQLFIKYRILNKALPEHIYYIIILILGLLLLIEILNTYRKNSIEVYDFYNDRIEFYSKKPWTFYYSRLQQVEIKKNIIDKIFGTGTIILSPDVKIENIPYVGQVAQYIMQIKQQYSGYQYNQYNQQDYL